jgi:multiple sugar transport system substrate-binding protein
MKKPSLLKPKSLFLTLALIVAATGCSSGADQTKRNNATPPPAGKDMVTLKYLDWEGKAAHDAMAANFKKFEELHPNIKVDYQSVTEDPNRAIDNYKKTLDALLAANDLPDVAFMREAEVLRWAKFDRLSDLTPYFKDGTFTDKLESNKFIDSDGKTVAVSAANEIIFIHYNKALFEQAGVELPPADKSKAWNWNQFLEVARKLTKDKNGKSPGESGFDRENIVQYGVDIPKGDFIWMPMVMSNEGGLLSPDGKELWIEKPETIEVIQKIADLANVENASPNPLQAQSLQGDLAQRFMTNKIAMLISGQWELAGLNDAVNKGELKNGTGVLPVFKKPVTTNAGGAPVIFKTSKHQKEAAELVKFILDPVNAQPNFDSGLWMPTEKSWYTDSSKVDHWIKTKVHPPEFKEAVVQYALTSTQPYYWFKASNYAQLAEVLNPALDQVWMGKRSAKEVVSEIAPKLKQIFEAK